MKKEFDVIVIGGGPAGMMAAISAASVSKSVLIIDKNKELGKKLLMSGGGRCNITNAKYNIKEFIDLFGKNGRFLYPSLNNFSIDNTIKFFNDNNIETKIEKDGKVFPVSNRSYDILNCLLNILEKNKVKILGEKIVVEIIKKNNSIEKIKLDNGEFYSAKKYILTTGGISYKLTGSTGDGLNFAKELGHTITDLYPSIAPIFVKEKWVKDLEGISLNNIKINIFQNNKKRIENYGDLVFMKDGISGPAILNSSRDINKIIDENSYISIDLKPDIDIKELEKMFQKELTSDPKKIIKNCFQGFIERRLFYKILELSDVNFDEKCCELKKEERINIINLIKNFKLNILKKFDFEKAMVTSGGIVLSEIDPKTLKSKIIDNLYFAGEILDLDGPTGGFNLQMCFSTGFLAGKLE